MDDVVRIVRFNEVHNKIECDAGIAMEIAEQYTFDVPGAKFSPLYRNKVWDGKIRIFQPMNRLLYCGLADNLAEFCSKRDYKVELVGDFAESNFDKEQAENFVSKLKPKHTPRDYQMDAFVHAVQKHRCLLVSPTASGKSLLIYLLSCYYAKKTLIVVPTTSLVHQLASDFEDYGYPKGSVHKIMSGKEKDTDRMIVCSTWQSIFKMPKSWFKQFGVVIVDEVHLAKAKSITTIMNNMTDCKYRFGLTGTLDKVECNELVLTGMFGPVKKVTTSAELMKRGQIAELEIKALVLKYPDEIRKIVAGSEYRDEMDFITQNKTRNNFIKNLALSLKGNSLILFQLVEKHGKVLFDLISSEAKDKKVFYIAGDVDSLEREDIRKIADSGRDDVIIVASYGTFSTGANIKNINNVVFASPSKSRVRNLQSIGRGLRISDTKSTATLYDIADDLSWKTKKNHTLLHFVERIRIYNSEKFSYKIFNIDLT